MSQATKVIEYIRDNGSITIKQAADDLGVYRLSARIYDIRAIGIDVQREMIPVLTRDGERTRVARYTIDNIPACFYAVTA